MEKLVFEFTTAEINLIVTSLSKLAYADSVRVINNIQSQYNKQQITMTEEAPEEPKE